MNPIFSIEHLVVAFALVVAAGVGLAWRSSAKCRRLPRVIIVVARLFALCCLGLIAINPGAWRHEFEQVQREIAVLIDQSSSMATEDVEGEKRWDAACRLGMKALAAARIPDNVQLYTFAEGVVPITQDALGAAAPVGETTDILHSGKTVLGGGSSAGRTLGGMLLLTDGRQIEPLHDRDLAIRARACNCPLYVLPLGGEVPVKDVAIHSSRKQYVAFAGQETRIVATIRNTGFHNLRTEIELLDADGKQVAATTVDVEQGGTAQAGFVVTPQNEGYFRYSMRTAEREGENTLANNAVHFGLSVLGSRIRVFLAEGVPYWDSKFLVQLLRKQPNVDVTSVYRLAEDRFFRVETDVSDVSEGSEAIFPDSFDEIGNYDLIIFGKGAEYFLTSERIALLRRFVRERGGSIIFSRGKPYNGEFPGLEPLEAVEWGTALAREFRVRPTVMGEDSGLFGDVLPGHADPVWERLPPLRVAHFCRKLKTFSQVLLEGEFTGTGQTHAFPVLVSRRYGKGLIVTVNADGLWRWDFFPSVKETGNTYNEIWSQICQWAVTHAEFLPGQEYALQLSENSVLPGEPLHARILCRRDDPVSGSPLLRVLQGDEVVQEVSPAPVIGMENQWGALVSLQKPGVYTVKLMSDDGITELGPRATVSILRPISESENLSADPVFLRALAEESGGAIITEDDLADVMHRLDPAPDVVDMAQATWVSAWDRWWCLCIVIVLFGIEWFVRRRNGLL